MRRLLGLLASVAAVVAALRQVAYQEVAVAVRMVVAAATGRRAVFLMAERTAQRAYHIPPAAAAVVVCSHKAALDTTVKVAKVVA